jgi:hypothetical protein
LILFRQIPTNEFEVPCSNGYTHKPDAAFRPVPSW